MLGPFARKWEEQRQRTLWKQLRQEKFIYPRGRFRGRGLVFCAGGERLFVNLWINLCVIRRILRCRLPIEVWHFGAREITPGMAALLQPFDVRLVDGEKEAPILQRGFDRGFALKTLAIEYSSFEEVIFLDTESYPLRDPAFLFDEPSYAWSGALFWPDIWKTDPKSSLWNVLELDHVDELEWETGQMVLNKRTCWKALQWAGHLNRNFDFFYHRIHGDKMTYYAAWKGSGMGYAMTSFPPQLLSSTSNRKMINQFDLEGRLLFQHRVMCDWSLTVPEPEDGEWLSFHHREACLSFLEELKGKWPDDAVHSRSENGGGPVKSASNEKLPRGNRFKEKKTAEGSTFSSDPAKNIWEVLSCQAWAAPYIAGPPLFSKGLANLAAPEESEQQDILRFLAVLIFLDPRLSPLLPERKEMERSGLDSTWGKLEELIHLLQKNRKGAGRLCLQGPLTSFIENLHGPSGEKEIARLLGNLVGKEWKHFLKSSGLSAPEPLPDEKISSSWSLPASGNKVLVLTPVKNAASQAEVYFKRLSCLSYPPELLSLGLFESDSRDGSDRIFPGEMARWQEKSGWRRSRFWKEDFHYEIPEGFTRWHIQVQGKRREILAKSRNRLTALALDDEDWVLWLDSDVTEYPPDIIQQLLSYRKEILQPHCVLEYGGRTFDGNAWRDQRSLSMSDMKGKEILARLDAVGGTMLFVKADLFRKGLSFPETPYCRKDMKSTQGPPWDPANPGEVETEGLGLMAADMGVICWGLPDLEILHGKM